MKQWHDAATDHELPANSVDLDRFVQALFSNEPPDGMAHELTPEDCPGVFANVARHYYLQLTRLIADQRHQYALDHHEPMDLAVTPAFFLRETRGAALRISLFVPHAESRHLAARMEEGEEQTLLAFDEAVAYFTEQTQFAAWIPITSWGQHLLDRARFEDQALATDAAAFNADIIGTLASLGYRFREDLDSILADIIEVAPDELFAACRRCGAPTSDDRGEDLLLGVNIDALFLCDDCLVRALIRPPLPGLVERPHDLRELLGPQPPAVASGHAERTTSPDASAAEQLVSIRVPAQTASQLRSVTTNIGGLAIRSMQARENVELEVTTRRLVALISDALRTPTSRGADGSYLFQLPRSAAEKWLGMIKLYIASHQRAGLGFNQPWQLALTPVAAGLDSALAGEHDGRRSVDWHNTTPRFAATTVPPTVEQPHRSTGESGQQAPPSTSTPANIAFTSFSASDVAELRRWINELKRTRQDAARDTMSDLCLLARWELHALASLETRLGSTTGSQPSSPVRVLVSRQDLSTLAWITSYARRHAGQLRINGAQLTRIADAIWDQMDLEFPHIAAAPRRLVAAVLLAGVASINGFKEMGLKPPGDDGDWTIRFEPILRHALDTGISHRPDELLIIDCTVEDVAKMAGLALGNHATTEDPRERADAALLVWHLAQSTTFEWADNLNRQLDVNNRTRGTRAGVSRPSTVSFPDAVSLLCSYCGTRFVSDVPRCPACDARIEQMVERLHEIGAEVPASITDYADTTERMPEPVPFAPVVVGSIIAFVIAFITAYIRWESGYWLILAFPAAIGAPAGFVAACLAINRSTLFRPYYWIFPVVIGLLAYMSTFYMEYEFAIGYLEDQGMANVRELLPFSDYLELRANEPITISRNGQEYEPTQGDAGQSLMLWGAEAAIAGGAGFYGWRRGVRHKHGLETQRTA